MFFTSFFFLLSHSITSVGNSIDNQPSTVKVNGSSLNSTTIRNSTPVTIIKAGPQQTSKDPVECFSYASITPLYSSNKIEKATENDVNNAINNNAHRQSYETAIQPSEDLNSQSTHSICDSSVDHQCTISNSSDVQDFVIRPEAFHKSLFPEIVYKDNIDDLPVLQHAEPVAVNAEDDDDGLDENIDNTENSFEIVISSSQCNTSFNPLITLPVPKGLNVVAVDDDGVHIFEDGNFLYALPGLTDKYSDDSDFYDSREDVTNISDLISPSYTAEQVNDEENVKTNMDKILSVSSSSNSPKSITTRKLVNKRSGSSDSLVKQPRVRFSSEPILLFHFSSRMVSNLKYTGTPRTTLPRCGQPGSDNRPHTSNSTQDHCIHNQPPSSIPIIPPTSTSNSKLLSSASSSSVTIANDSSAQNTVPGLLKPRCKLHIGAFNVRTLCQIGQQDSLAKTL
ncbi:unnamed protein product, partial [Schistosoma curassoni]|uniref:Uncharacterized protein n=1 Tax=Schistosoma curassoni TaxID=6186 RepID=A0A183KNZ6_9TREM